MDDRLKYNPRVSLAMVGRAFKRHFQNNLTNTRITPHYQKGITNASVQTQSNGPHSIFCLPETAKVKTHFTF